MRLLADLLDIPWEKEVFKYLDAKSQSVLSVKKGNKTKKKKKKRQKTPQPLSMDFVCNFWFADKLFKQV